MFPTTSPDNVGDIVHSVMTHAAWLPLGSHQEVLGAVPAIMTHSHVGFSGDRHLLPGERAFVFISPLLQALKCEAEKPGRDNKSQIISCPVA